MMYTRKNFLILIAFVVSANALASPEPVKSGKGTQQEEADDVSSKSSRMITKLERSKNEDSEDPVMPDLRQEETSVNDLDEKTSGSFEKESTRNEKEQDLGEKKDTTFSIQQSAVSGSDVFYKVSNIPQNNSEHRASAPVQLKQPNLSGLLKSSYVNLTGSQSQLNAGLNPSDVQGRDDNHKQILSQETYSAQYDQKQLSISSIEKSQPFVGLQKSSNLDLALNDVKNENGNRGPNYEVSAIEKTDNQNDQINQPLSSLTQTHQHGNQSQELMQSQSKQYDDQNWQQNIAQETQNNQDRFWENMVNEFQEDPMQLGHQQLSASNEESSLRAVESQVEEQEALPLKTPSNEQLRQDLPSLPRQNEDRSMSGVSDSHETAHLSSPEKHLNSDSTDKGQDINGNSADVTRSSPTPRSQSWQDDEDDDMKEYNDIYYDDNAVSPSPSAPQYQGYGNAEAEDGEFEDDWYEDPNIYDDETEKSFKYDDSSPDQEAEEQNMQIIENDAEWDKGQGLFEEDVVDTDMIKKDKQPTAPSSMVLFYTWMIVAILIMVVSISTYQTRCRGLRISQPAHTEDRRSLLDHEYA